VRFRPVVQTGVSLCAVGYFLGALVFIPSPYAPEFVVVASSTWYWSVAALALASCGSTQLPLTSAEEARLETLGARLGKNVRVHLQYDRDAVTRHRPSGTLFIVVTKTVARTESEPFFCHVDSLALQQKAAAIAAELVPHLRFTQYHRRIIVSYDAYRTLDHMSSEGVCTRMVGASLRTTPLVFHNYDYMSTGL
jgi:hypothetical protein